MFVVVVLVVSLLALAIDWLTDVFRWQFLVMCAAGLAFAKAVNYGRPR